MGCATNNSTPKAMAKLRGCLKKKLTMGSGLTLPPPIHAPMIVKKIESTNTVTKMFIVMTERKLSPFVVILRVIHSHGLYVAKTKATTAIHMNGMICNARRYAANVNPNSKHVINGAMMFTEITEMIKTKSANSHLFRGNFM